MILVSYLDTSDCLEIEKNEKAFHSSCSELLGSTLHLTGALKWGTVWTSTSTGTGIMKGQSWTFAFY